MHTTLVAVEMLAASVWVGGLVAIGLVARIARSQLDRGAQVRFFQALGRSYLFVGGGALVVALVAGGLLLVPGNWDLSKTVAAVTAAALAVVTAAGVVQARSQTTLRKRALSGAAQPALAERVRRGARTATTLRALIGVLTIALVVVVAVIV